MKWDAKPWVQPDVPETIPHGDMPGDKICVTAEHIRKAACLFPPLAKRTAQVLADSPTHKAVLTVCGCSGVGKSEIASVLGYFFSQLGIDAYILSGDNYPHRYPALNDAERLFRFRNGGVEGLLAAGLYTSANAQALRQLWQEDTDAAPESAKTHPWLAVYQKAGREVLSHYLGTSQELDFAKLSGIVNAFKQGEKTVWLKRMGRSDDALWYDAVDLSNVQVLIIEWTHGNSDGYSGVDIPVLLNSTPAETLLHRMNRNRDGKPDSPFTTMVLEIEQGLLEQQAHKAQLILSKAGDLLSYEAYQHTMAQARKEQA